ncbi:Alpha-1A adrenergic receptor [Holothuria leucospilota]|uniref:Alpha-1A adrenergic receptor n=1 Tax=Holothuria leucospilota TaxID=206669 RepID=A0A9Q1BNI3_HOLLE|nr:Alpha-1A adrenergic receptor [Holothuria leucospilota]
MNYSNPLLETVPASSYLVFQAVFMAFIMVFTILGNIAVCYVVYRTKSIATVTGMSITSLAVADLLRGSMVLPFVITTSILGAQWTFGRSMCIVTGLFHTMLASASVMTLGVVSLDRYIAILKPLKYATIITTIRAAFILIFVWTVSALTALLPLVGWSDYIFIPWTCICVVDWRPGYSSGYPFFYLSIAFLLPLVVLVYCYFRIFIVARSQSRRVMALEVPSLDGNTLKRNTPGGITRGQRFTNMRKEKKASLTLFIVMGIFMSCVTPYCIVYLIASYRPTTNSLAAVGVTSMLSFVNSAANPMIYGILNRKFRRVFLHVMTCKGCKNVPQNPALQSDHGTASTVMVRKRLNRKDEAAENVARSSSPEGVFRLSVAATAGGTMACVLGNKINGLNHFTLKHLPTIEDVSEPHEVGKKGCKPSTEKPNTKKQLRTLTFETSENNRNPNKVCDVMVLASPMIRSIHIDRE